MNQQPHANLLTARIICGALIFSVAMLWLLAIVLTDRGRSPMDPTFPLDSTTLTGLAQAVGVGALVAALFFRRRARAGAIGSADPEHPSPSYDDLSRLQTNLIIAWALLEGAAMILAVFYMLTGVSTLPVTAAVIVAIGFGLTFPRAAWYPESERPILRQ